MKRASAFFSEDDRRRIREAVGKAEQSTSGEIVVVVASRSDVYPRAEDIVGLLVSILALALLWWPMRAPPSLGSWSSPGAVVSLNGLILALCVVAAGFGVGVVLASRLDGLRRLFIPPGQMDRAVEQAALRSFFQSGVRATAQRTGILIYVSLFERMVRVAGDQAITEKLSEADWFAVRDLVLDGLRRRCPADGLINAIEQCGRKLQAYFPIKPGDVNEVPNDLQLID
jgi:putative membrane protein